MNKFIKFLAVIALTLPLMVKAEWSPGNKPVTVTIPFTPGGGVDITFKHFQNYASQRGITLVPNYKPGADGLIGMNEISAAPADGTHISFATSGTMAIQKLKNPGAEVTSISQLRKSIFAFVTPEKSSIKTLADLESRLKSSTSEKNTITMGYGAPGQLAVIEGYIDTVGPGIKPVLVPYKGGAPVVLDVITGQLDFAALPLQLVNQHIDSGKLNFVASTSKARLKDYPNVQSIYSKYPRWQETDVFCVVGPANMNSEAFAFWSALLKQYLADPSVTQDFAKEYTEALPFGSKQLDQVVKESMARLGK